MTERLEPSEAAKRKAQELFDSALHLPSLTILTRYIQTVSDVAKVCQRNAKAVGGLPETVHMLGHLILPDEPDPLEQVFNDAVATCLPHEKLIDAFRSSLAKRGLKIVQSDD